MAKREIDVEQLLRWAYREELPKGETSSAEAVWDAIADYGANGGVACQAEGGPQRYDFGEPDPDAKKLAAAVTALPDLIIDWEASTDALMGDMAAILVARDVLMVRPLRTAALVTMHAKMGNRPDWRDAVPWTSPVPSAKDHARPMLVGECRGRNLYSTGSYCPIRWEPSPITIALARAEYAAWHRGLHALCQTVTLDRHVVLPPAAPAQPWFERQPARRIYAVGERATVKLPLKPARKTAGPARRQHRAGEVRHIAVDKGAET